MRWSRKGVVIRLLIYVPLIGYLGHQAANKWNAEREPLQADAPPTPGVPDDKLAPFKRVIEMPDGTKQEIVELTEAQAHDLLGYPLPEGPPTDAVAAPPPAAQPE